MEFFTGFKWAVPIGFFDAVSLCRFERGDILYDTVKAYQGEWGCARKLIDYSLQVKFPIKVRGAAEITNSIFKSNWNSDVRVELYRKLERVSISQLHTTQGRLYTALWKGDITILEKNQAEPHIPLLGKEVTQILNEESQKVKAMSFNSPVFVMAHNKANTVSKEKYFKVLAKLKQHLSNGPKVLSPQKYGLGEFENIAPTIDIVCFPTNGVSVDELYKLVKSAVYISSTEAKKTKFSLKQHGIIV